VNSLISSEIFIPVLCSSILMATGMFIFLQSKKWENVIPASVLMSTGTCVETSLIIRCNGETILADFFAFIVLMISTVFILIMLFIIIEKEKKRKEKDNG
jgi:hypothetical protein